MAAQKRRGISPVIATVIIVAVTIAIAIAVAFWMTGIVGIFTGTVEKLEIVSLYAVPNAQGGWDVTVIVKNTGTISTSIDNIFINGVPVKNCNPAITPNPDVTATPQPLKPGGDPLTITFTLGNGNECGGTKFTSGVSIEVKLHSTGGKEYPKLITLP
ncbi:archaellin/type IV pilin N-terminal domain-containing protein [Thermofilum pendens]|nr:archaellin/type IV pilin N-terminal domain-containing protein [Thermofilum pendens]